MKKFILIFLQILNAIMVLGQQDPMYTHYRYNTQAVNPAYAGSRKALTVTALHRSQWLGMPGAPTSQTLTAHAPFAQDRFGIGIGITNDAIAKNSAIGFQIDFAYRILIGQNSAFAMGLKGSFNSQAYKLNEVFIKNSSDPIFAETIGGRFLPNFGTGLYFQSKKYFVGVSAPTFLKNKFLSVQTQGSIDSLSQRHFYFITGFVQRLNDDLSLKPTAFCKYVQGMGAQVDITAQMVYKEKFLVGLMYRTNDAVGLLAGFNFTEQLTIGYSFDYSIGNTTGKFNGGSHELMIRYDFYFNHSKGIFSPRHF